MGCEFTKLIGLEVIGVYGYASDGRKKITEPRYVLFSDRQTYIEFDKEWDHTFSGDAVQHLTIKVRQDEVQWKRIFEDKDTYPAARKDL